MTTTTKPLTPEQMLYHVNMVLEQNAISTIARHNGMYRKHKPCLTNGIETIHIDAEGRQCCYNRSTDTYFVNDWIHLEDHEHGGEPLCDGVYWTDELRQAAGKHIDWRINAGENIKNLDSNGEPKQ